MPKPAMRRSSGKATAPGWTIGYCQIEKMTNLDQLPDAGFLVSAFPFKIKGASGGFTRAVAIFEE
jgi:kynurenine formamidase